MAFAYDLDNSEQSDAHFRADETLKTRRWYWYGAVFCAARAAVAPWAMFMFPSMRSITGPTDEVLVYSSIGLMIVFAIGAMIGRYLPMLATLMVISAFSYFCYYDLTHFKGIIEIGLIGKLLLCVCVIRGAMSAVLSRTI